jgi:hypothetical protein
LILCDNGLSGTEARLGDRVRITNGDTGTVVASMDTDEYGPEAAKENWAHTGGGILVRTDRGALVQFDGKRLPKAPFEVGRFDGRMRLS